MGRNLGTFKTVALAEFSSKAIDKLLDILDLNIFQIQIFFSVLSMILISWGFGSCNNMLNVHCST